MLAAHIFVKFTSIVCMTFMMQLCYNFARRFVNDAWHSSSCEPEAGRH